MNANINFNKDDDIIVVEEVGEVRKIIQFKNYRDFIDYQKQKESYKMSNADKIATKNDSEESVSQVETDMDRFKKLCDVAGLTSEQMFTCKKLVITCEHFGVIDVEVKYNSIGGLEDEN